MAGLGQDSCRARNRFIFKKLDFLGPIVFKYDDKTNLTDFNMQIPVSICEEVGGNMFDKAMKNNQAMGGTCNIRTKCEQKYDEVKFIAKDQNGMSIVFDTFNVPRGCMSKFNF